MRQRGGGVRGGRRADVRRAGPGARRAARRRRAAGLGLSAAVAGGRQRARDPLLRAGAEPVGVFEFGQLAPSGVAGWTAKNRTLDAFGSGILAVVVASPCTAPFMGAALGFALTAPDRLDAGRLRGARRRHGAAVRPLRVVSGMAAAAAPSGSVARAVQAGAGVSALRDGDLARMGAGRAARQRRAAASSGRASRRRFRAVGMAHRAHGRRAAVGDRRTRRARGRGNDRRAALLGRARARREGRGRGPGGRRRRMDAVHAGHACRR